MKFRTFPQAAAVVALSALETPGAPAQGADILTTNRVSAALATDIVVATCAKMTYAITALVVDADGVTQALIRGDGARIHTVQTAHDRAFNAVPYGRAGSVTAKATPTTRRESS